MTGCEMTVRRNMKYNEITLKYHYLLLVSILMFFFLVGKIKYSSSGKKQFFGSELFGSSVARVYGKTGTGL